MSEAMRMWVEVAFNISYLGIIWTLVAFMLAKRKQVAFTEQPVAVRFLWAFAFLALGDTGHVGFRVLAYASGGLENNPTLVGLGALSTAYTVTVFYMLLVDVWRIRYRKTLGTVEKFLLLAGAVRLLIMVFPQNRWDLLVAPYAWSLIRNSLLVIQGLGVMLLILRDSRSTGDRSFNAIGWMIALSFAFYAPVILWVQWVPVLGMLMIPKTCAYIAIALIAYRGLFLKPGQPAGSLPERIVQPAPPPPAPG